MNWVLGLMGLAGLLSIGCAVKIERDKIPDGFIPAMYLFVMGLVMLLSVVSYFVFGSC